MKMKYNLLPFLCCTLCYILKGGWAQTMREHGLVVSDTSAEALKAVLMMNEKCPFISKRVSKRRLRDAVDMVNIQLIYIDI